MKGKISTDTPVQSFSQFGEDALILKFFAGKTDGFFVEVGANDPENLSQTFLLEDNGWRGILVEPLPNCCERLRSRRPRSQIFQVACGSPEQCGKALLQVNGELSKLAAFVPGQPSRGGCEEVSVMTLDEILKQAGDPMVDFLSIDVEGLELEVLHGFNLESHQPGLLLIEDNLPNRLNVHRHMKQHGYRLVKRTGCNNWYVPNNQPFDLSSTWERMKMFRKMYLGTAFRKLKATLAGNRIK
jgi:FkbM family methyltransferase